MGLSVSGASNSAPPQQEAQAAAAAEAARREAEEAARRAAEEQARAEAARAAAEAARAEAERQAAAARDQAEKEAAAQAAVAAAEAERAAQAAHASAVAAASEAFEAQQAAYNTAAELSPEAADATGYAVQAGMRDIYAAASLDPSLQQSIFGSSLVITDEDALDASEVALTEALKQGTTAGMQELTAQVQNVAMNPELASALVERNQATIEKLGGQLLMLPPAADPTNSPVSKLLCDLSAAARSWDSGSTQKLADALKAHWDLPNTTDEARLAVIQGVTDAFNQGGVLAYQLHNERFDAILPSPAEAAQQIKSLPLDTVTRSQLLSSLQNPMYAGMALDARQLLAAGSGLPPEQAAALVTQGINTPDIREFVNASTFSRLQPDAKSKVMSVLTTLSQDDMNAGIAGMTALLADGDRVFQTDSRGVTLLDNLAAVSTQPLNPQLIAAQNALQLQERGQAAVEGAQLDSDDGLAPRYKVGAFAFNGSIGLNGSAPAAPDAPSDAYTRSKLMGSLLVEVANPNLINQSTYSTCLPTSIQYSMVTNDPAEYARLVGGLVGAGAGAQAAGSVQMRGGGLLQLQAEYLAQQPGDQRSLTEALFQSAAMEYGDPTGVYDANNPSAAPTGKGFADRLLASLYGVTYSERGWAQPEKSVQFLEQHNSPEQPILVTMSALNRHVFTYDKVEDGRVFLRNPWGAIPEGQGAPSELQGARVEDAAQGLISISKWDFVHLQPSIVADKALLDAFGEGPGISPELLTQENYN